MTKKTAFIAVAILSGLCINPLFAQTTISELQQLRSDGITVITDADFTNETTVIFQSSISASMSTASVWMEVELQLVGVAFTGVANYTSSPAAVVIGSGTVSITAAGLAEGGYKWQARAVDEFGMVSAWVEFEEGAIEEKDFIIDVTPPDLSALQQYKTDGTTIIPVGGFTNENEVIFEGYVSDNLGMVNFQIEYRDITTAFSSVPVVESGFVLSGSIPKVSSPTLADDKYHWQARAVDEAGNKSVWITFGANPETDADFIIDTTPPGLASLQQLDTDTGPVIADDGWDNDLTVWFKATVSDNLGQIKLQVEVKSVGVAFDGTISVESSLTDSGTSALVSYIAPGEGSYKWRARAIDEANNTSAWVEFEEGTAEETDFKIDISPPVLTALEQRKTDGTTIIPVGGYTNEDSVMFRCTIADTNLVKLQVEAELVGIAFDGTPTGESVLTIAGAGISITISGFAEGQYHWQAQAVDEAGNTSGWISFGGNLESEPDFIVDFSLPTAFSLLYPLDDCIISTDSATFVWTSSTHPSGITYNLVIGEDPQFTSPWIYTTPSTFLVVSPLPAGASTQYFWKVEAVANSGAITTSDTWYMLVDLDFPSGQFTVFIKGGDTVEYYRMVSPGGIPQPDGFAQLEAQLGSYNPLNWRMFKWDNQDQIYFEAPAIPTLQPGRGYWIISRYDATLTLTGKEVTLSSYYVKLYPGWNQVGFPVKQDIPWTAVLVHSETDTYNASDPANPFVLNILYEWVGTYVGANYVRPNMAYFVKNTSGGIIWMEVPSTYPKPEDEPLYEPLPEGAELPPSPPSSMQMAGLTSSGGGGCVGILSIDGAWLSFACLLLLIPILLVLVKKAK
jgi:hypothetical protein